MLHAANVFSLPYPKFYFFYRSSQPPAHLLVSLSACLCEVQTTHNSSLWMRRKVISLNGLTPRSALALLSRNGRQRGVHRYSNLPRVGVHAFKIRCLAVNVGLCTLSVSISDVHLHRRHHFKTPILTIILPAVSNPILFNRTRKMWFCVN